MRKLISMTDFVEKELKNYNSTDFDYTHQDKTRLLLRLENYLEFLKQPLELWMFVPCKLVDSVWIVLEKPDLSDANGRQYDSRINEDHAWARYNEAKERCLFQNIEYVKAKNIGEYSFVRIAKLSSINYPNFWNGVTVESLIPYDLQLTPTALNQLGL